MGHAMYFTTTGRIALCIAKEEHERTKTMETIYRVKIRSAASLQPGETFWRYEVLYCGSDRTEALIAYHQSEPDDIWRGYGNHARETVFEVLDTSDLAISEPGKFVRETPC